MPRQTREERRAAQAAAADRFKQWLTPRMKDNALGPTEIAQRAALLGATFDKGAVSHWAAGDNVPDPTNTVLVARVLGADPVQALLAAGYGEIAALHDPVLALLQSIAMPGLTGPIAEQYLADLEAARDRAREDAQRVRDEAANG